jgi:hypothetical protein
MNATIAAETPSGVGRPGAKPVLSRRLLLSAGASLALMVSRMARSREMPPAERFIQDLERFAFWSVGTSV